MKSYFNFKKAGHYLFFALAVAVFGMVVILNQGDDIARAAPASTIRLEPSTLTVTNGQAFSLEAKINPGTNQVSSVELHVTFDATNFQIIGIVASPRFPLILSSEQLDNTAGTATITATVSLPSAGNQPNYVTTDTTFATLSFRAIGQNSTSSISIAPQTEAAAYEEVSNVITGRTPAQITIGRRYTNADFALLAADWLRNLSSSPADLNLDSTVDTRDLGIMMSNWSI